MGSAMGNRLRAKANSLRRRARGFKGARRSAPLLDDARRPESYGDIAKDLL
jgi:hypothetical protein